MEMRFRAARVNGPERFGRLFLGFVKLIDTGKVGDYLEPMLFEIGCGTRLRKAASASSGVGMRPSRIILFASRMGARRGLGSDRPRLGCTMLFEKRTTRLAPQLASYREVVGVASMAYLDDTIAS